MRAQGQGVGLRQLRQIFARMVKGEVGLRVEIWRTARESERLRVAKDPNLNPLCNGSVLR